MITYEEVLALRRALPPRLPRGSEANKLRSTPGHAFGAALDQFQREHGESWFDYGRRSRQGEQGKLPI